MIVEPTALPGVLMFTPTPHGDTRGRFTELFRDDIFHHHAPGHRFVQDNASVSLKAGTVRGLHFQRVPHAQGKLVRVQAGAILDVVVDARQGSPTFGQHIAIELSAENMWQIWVPPGCLHGLCTLVDHTEVHYKVTALYHADLDGAVRWNDPDLAIDWPVSARDAILSPRDAAAPTWAAMVPGFGPHG
jgi:dTDP-4-dehydrorhamnose 3,5-epimerase